jgi:diguanylate cyclase (GGDEF)-like protein
MTDARFPAVPASLKESVRATSVPHELRALFDQIDAPIGLELEVHAEGEPPPLALQLLRLASEGQRLRLLDVRELPAGTQPRVRLVNGTKDLVFETDSLAGGAPALARRVVDQLLEAGEAGRVVERLCREAGRHEALRRLTRAMLETHSIDRLRTIMLLGMTSGHALGLGRAALFVYDEDGRALVGVSAVGPADEVEALGEAAGRERPLAELLARATEAEEEQAFEEFVRTIAVDVTPDPRDEVGLALEASRPMIFARERPVSPAIAALQPSKEFLVAAIKLRGKPIGVVVADNRYTGAPIERESLEFAGFLLDTMALASENLRLLESVETLARHDGLTGLFNRREFETRMAEEQSRSQRLGSQCGLLLFDVDHLRSVNETRGNKAGDELLQSIGVLLRSTLRTHDIVARFGGDEFAVLVTDTNEEQILAIARRVGSQALGIGVSLSVGGSVWPRDNQEFSVLYAEADAALWEAKRGGRGRARIEGRAEALVFAPPEDGETPFS